MLPFRSGSVKKRLEEEVETLRNESQHLYDQSEQLRNENERLLESHTTKSDELQAQKAQYQELRTHNESLGRELSGLLDEHEKLKNVGSRQSQELREKKQKSLQLANELLCLRVEHEIQTRNWNDERAETYKSNKKLHQQIAAQEQDLQEERTRASFLRTEVNRYVTILQDPVQMQSLSAPYRDSEVKNRTVTELNLSLELAVADRDAVIEGQRSALAIQNIKIKNALQEIATLNGRLAYLDVNIVDESELLAAKVGAFEALVRSWVRENTPTSYWLPLGNHSTPAIINVLRRHGLATPLSPPCLISASQLQQGLSQLHSRTAICQHVLMALIFKHILHPAVNGLEKEDSAMVDRIEERLLKGCLPLSLHIKSRERSTHCKHLDAGVPCRSPTGNGTLSERARKAHFCYIGDLDDFVPSTRQQRLVSPSH